MASPQRFTEMTDPGDEPILVDEDFEVVEDDADVVSLTATADNGGSSSGAAGWILFGLLVTGCTATVLLVGLPMQDELDALRADKHRINEELKNARTHEEDLAGEIVNLEAARTRLTSSLAQKSVELEESARAQADLERRLKDEIKKNEARAASDQAQRRRGRRR